jgi:hypothetical protein
MKKRFNPTAHRQRPIKFRVGGLYSNTTTSTAEETGPELPNESNKVDEIKAYMDQQGIEYDQKDTKAELLRKISDFQAG